jgi:hypothetical protein
LDCIGRGQGGFGFRLCRIGITRYRLIFGRNSLVTVLLRLDVVGRLCGAAVVGGLLAVGRASILRACIAPTCPGGRAIVSGPRVVAAIGRA